MPGAHSSADLIALSPWMIVIKTLNRINMNLQGDTEEQLLDVGVKDLVKAKT